MKRNKPMKPNEDFVLVGMIDGRVWFSEDEGKTWKPLEAERPWWRPILMVSLGTLIGLAAVQLLLLFLGS